jgi:hypothetical protein
MASAARGEQRCEGLRLLMFRENRRWTPCLYHSLCRNIETTTNVAACVLQQTMTSESPLLFLLVLVQSSDAADFEPLMRKKRFDVANRRSVLGGHVRSKWWSHTDDTSI